MTNWRVNYIKYLSEKSITSNNMGHYPLTPKYEISFRDDESGIINITNDLKIKMYNRDEIIKGFVRRYNYYDSINIVSILCVVVNQNNYTSITKFLNTFKRKLKRKNIEVLGYFWVRDVGDINFEKHYHLIMATSHISKNVFRELFSKKKHNKYEVEFKKTKHGIFNYIKEKDLFAAKKQRAFGKSRVFKNISKKIIN
jgi:hypothetical protein